MTKEDLIEIFRRQIEKNIVVTEVGYNRVASAKCYGNCPELIVGDVVLYFVIVEAVFDPKLTEMKRNGNLLSLDKGIAAVEDTTVDRLARVSLRYLDDPNCELLNFRLTKTKGDSMNAMFPVFTNLIK